MSHFSRLSTKLLLSFSCLGSSIVVWRFVGLIWWVSVVFVLVVFLSNGGLLGCLMGLGGTVVGCVVGCTVGYVVG